MTRPATIEGTKTRRSTRPLSAREIAQQRQADEAARSKSLYGSLLPDVEYLRRKFPVSREGVMIRVDGVLRTEAQVREIAARERRLEQPAPAMLGVIPSGRRVDNPRSPMARHEIEKPKSESARDTPAEVAGTADINGRVGSDLGNHTTAAAVLRAQMPSSTDPARLEREAARIEQAAAVPPKTLEQRIAALESRQDEFEAKVKAAMVDVCGHLGLEVGR